jgi:hypothetical protein
MLNWKDRCIEAKCQYISTCKCKEEDCSILKSYALMKKIHTEKKKKFTSDMIE